MITKQTALVVEKINKAYNFEGKSGTSLKLRVLVGADIFSCKTTEDIINSVEEGKYYVVSFDIRSRQEIPQLTISAVEKK